MMVQFAGLLQLLLEASGVGAPPASDATTLMLDGARIGPIAEVFGAMTLVVRP